MSMSKDIVYRYFVEKSDLFRIVMDSELLIKRGRKIARGIAKQLMLLGLDKGSILDIGCGTGRVALELAELGYNVTGIDISEKYIDIAIMRAKERKLSDRTRFIVCDAREIRKCFNDTHIFDAAIFVWSSVIGYYDIDTDIHILKSVKELVKNSGFLVMADMVNKDYIELLNSLVGNTETYTDYGSYAIVERSVYNPVTGEILIKQRFYRKVYNNLEYIDEIYFKMRLYSLNELIEVARKAGWCLVKVLKDIWGELGYSIFKPINIIFQSC